VADLLPTEGPPQSSERSTPRGAPAADDPVLEARLAIVDAVFETIWNGRWKGLTVVIDGLEEFDPLSVWRNNLRGLKGHEFEFGIEQAKVLPDPYPPTPGQFRELCKAAPMPEADRKRLASYKKGRRLTDEDRKRARAHLAKMRAMLQ
jgi:hypothetical protein